MKSLLVTAFISVALLLPFASAKEADWKIARADVVLISDHRVSDWRATPLKIVDSKIVLEIVGLLKQTEGSWKKGWATAPTGEVSFAFYRGEEYLGIVGVGDKFLMRGRKGGWESIPISSEMRERLRAFAENKPKQSTDTKSEIRPADPQR
ncbi:hypothetical protein [Oleiharenicola lentus]|uniref:hypothetical protein n=1 Tax=Oleiharenicola lentus TaxID=2508720 RepID=UPI003F68181F